MRGRRLASVMLCMALGCSAAFAPSAVAKPKPKLEHIHLLPFRSCNSVLVAADFLDELEEVAPPSVIGSVAEGSVCKYAGLSADGPSGRPAQFTEGGLGVECLANAIKIIGEGGTAPGGGCYRLATATIVVARGRAVEKLLQKLGKGVKARSWPAGFGRYVLHGVGSKAEFGYNDARDGYGYLQVVNATVIVETSEGGSLIHILKDAASLL
jgi:hypothetical protein